MLVVTTCTIVFSSLQGITGGLADTTQPGRAVSSFCCQVFLLTEFFFGLRVSFDPEAELSTRGVGLYLFGGARALKKLRSSVDIYRKF